MENINELKHQILDCANYFGWEVRFFNDDSILISLDENIVKPSGCGYYEMEKTFHMSVDYEMSQMKFPNPVPEYKFQVDHLNDLVNYFDWSVDIKHIARNNLTTIYLKDNMYVRKCMGIHIPYAVDLAMNFELKKMGLQ